MKAVTYENYGPPEVLTVQTVEKPQIKDQEVLVRIFATTVTAEEPKQRSLNFPFLIRLPYRLMFGFFRPKNRILGMEFAGRIEEIGSAVKKWRTGDRVFGYTGLSFGAYAEYKALPEDAIMASVPESQSYESIVGITNGSLSALTFLKKKGKISNGESVLIYGASGSVGTAAIQLAKHFGASVTAVCSGRNVDLVRSLGADNVIDYTKEDFLDSSDKYDLIFDTIGTPNLSRSIQKLNKNGRLVLTEFGFPEMLRALWHSLFGSKKVIFGASNFHWKTEDLVFFNKLINSDELAAVVDRTYSLEQMPEAHRYVESGRKRGNVVVRLEA